MPKIKESTIYLNFFKSFWWLLLALAIVGGALGFQVSSKQEVVHTTQVQLEVEHDPAQITQRAQIADEVVGVLRSQVIQDNLKISPASRVVVHKNGPLLINLVVENPNLEVSSLEAFKLRDYAVERYQVEDLGASFSDKQGDIYLMSLIGTGIGLLIALTASLFKTYLSNY